MLGDVLEGGFVLVSAHSGLAKNQVFVRIANSKVTSFLVVFGTCTALHHERGVGSCKMGQNFQVKGGSKVVGVGDKHVFVSSLKKSIKASRADECSVEISVSRRAPFVAWVRLANSGLESLGTKLRNFILKHLKSLFGSKIRVFGAEEFKSVIRSRETVHQHKLYILSELFPHAHDLLRGKVEESVSVFHFKERLGFIETHTSTKTSIELEHHGFGK
mmetsp:Transcript_27704/g.58206  ORF Transcript_27704/g.58206 Transcript_27704/m.58206 type:complete len:217 (-) Transcript_27704:127-777(-)